ncbi:MAG: YHS domain-containing protein [Rhodobacteraceae bacterium]|nr:YHS domain-containing protein [Paracoccaceae bacterium]
MFTRRTTLALIASAVALPARAATPEIFTTNGVAINGYDPVSYFIDGWPIEGTPRHSLDWKGAIWHFATAQNRNDFADHPEHYAPQFGGYCAFAASKGAIAPTVPEAWTVYNYRLYLNANLRARELWLLDVPGNIALAEGFWPEILG